MELNWAAEMARTKVYSLVVVMECWLDKGRAGLLAKQMAVLTEFWLVVLMAFC